MGLLFPNATHHARKALVNQVGYVALLSTPSGHDTDLGPTVHESFQGVAIHLQWQEQCQLLDSGRLALVLAAPFNASVLRTRSASEVQLNEDFEGFILLT